MTALHEMDSRPYVNAGPVRKHLLSIKHDRLTWTEIADAVGTSRSSIENIYRGTYVSVLQATAERIMELEPEDFPPAEFEPDDLLVERILTGQPYSIPPRETMSYARLMHTEHGWTISQISRGMHMSWSRAREATQ